MITVNPKESGLRVEGTGQMQQYLTSRILAGDERRSESVHVAPWSGEEYYDKLKRDIKSLVKKKRSETSAGQSSPYGEGHSRTAGKRVKTVHLQMTPLWDDDHLQGQWSKIIPKKSSSKILRRQVSPLLKHQSQYKIQKTIYSPIVDLNPIHQRKTSLKHFPQTKPRIARLQTEIAYHNMKKREQQQSQLNKGQNIKNHMFFFETKNKNIVSTRQRMIMKIRNLERGKVDRAITNYN